MISGLIDSRSKAVDARSTTLRRRAVAAGLIWARVAELGPDGTPGIGIAARRISIRGSAFE
jgi:hypothetical protein